jgi:hypothetical protein
MHSVQKVLLQIFPPVCPLPHLFLHCDTQSRVWVHVMNFFDMLCALWNIHNMLCTLWLWTQNMPMFHSICF